MVQNKPKFFYIVNTLMKKGWGYYRKDKSTLILWVDPLYTIDYRLKDAYIKLHEREVWDGEDLQRSTNE